MYGKHFASMYTGSMYGAGAVVFAVWGYVIAHTVDSQVELNPRVIAAALGAQEEEVEAAIDFLCQPDEQSRSEDEGGRRLLRQGQFSYRVPTYEHYHRIKSEVDRREQNRLAQQRFRDKKKSHEDKHTSPPVIADVSKSTSMSAASAQAEAEAEAVKDLSPAATDEKDSQPASKATVEKRSQPKPENGDGKKTWLTPFAEVWERRVQADPNFGELALVMGRLKKKGHAESDIYGAWVCYVEGADPQFLSINRFGTTYGVWAGTAKTKADELAFPEEDAALARMEAAQQGVA